MALGFRKFTQEEKVIIKANACSYSIPTVVAARTHSIIAILGAIV